MFGKIFDQIYDSSVAEDWTVRVVFQDFIVLADINGVVDKTPEAIARRTNVPLDVVLKAIATLEQEDVRSRSKEEGGRRIRRLDDHRDWGWEVVNYHKYREIASDDQRRAKTRERTKKWRDSAAAKSSVTNGDTSVTNGDACDAMQKQKQKDNIYNLPEIPPMKRSEFDRLVEMRGYPKDMAEWFWNDCEKVNWLDGKGRLITNVDCGLKNLGVSWRKNRSVAGDISIPPAKTQAEREKEELETQARLAETRRIMRSNRGKQ